MVAKNGDIDSITLLGSSAPTKLICHFQPPLVKVELWGERQPKWMHSKNYPDLEFVGHLYGNTPSWEYTEGAEGEGIVYTFIPHNNKLLILYRTFIDENVITNYKNVKNFITYAKQAEIMTEIIESIKFTN